MTRISIKALLIAVLCVAATLNAQSRESLFDAFQPGSGWKAEGVRRTYTESDLDRFDPAMAPTLKRYGIEGIAVQVWSTAEGVARVTIYEMVDSAAAYGLFSIKRNVNALNYEPFPVGAEGFRVDRRVAFWQGPFVIELEGDPAAVDAWARFATSRIPGPSARPAVSGYLPAENRVAASDKYIVSASNIDGAWGFDLSRLGFENSAEAATATYMIKGKPVRLLLIVYPTQQLAKQYEENLGTTSDATARFKKRDGPLLAIVEPDADPAAAEALLANIDHQFQVTWNERRPGPNVADVVLTIFRFIGIALSVTLGAGIVFGIIRVVVKWLFPGRVFDRPKDMEVIQLKLNQIYRDWSKRAGGPPRGRPTQ